MSEKIRKAPCLLSAEAIKNWSIQREIDGRYYLNRPLTIDTVQTRIRLAWGVFTGKYDAVVWHKQ